MITSNNTQLFAGVLFIVTSIVCGFIAIRKLKNLPEDSDDKIFNAKNKRILGIRIGICVIVFLIYGIWLLLTIN